MTAPQQWSALAELAVVLRALHIAAGFTALVVAPGAMIARKGGQWHRRWGWVYAGAMAIVAATAVGLATIRPNPLLLLLAVFSFYLAFSGVRVLRRRRRPGTRGAVAGEGRAGVLDWGAAGLALASGMALLTLAVWPRAAERGVSGVAPVPLVLGALAVALAAREIRSLRRPPADPRAWWYQHMGRMLGAYIATVSAFPVVNLTALPPAARFLWPTVIGTPLIALWTRSYRRRFAASASAPRSSPTPRRTTAPG